LKVGSPTTHSTMMLNTMTRSLCTPFRSTTDEWALIASLKSGYLKNSLFGNKPELLVIVEEVDSTRMFITCQGRPLGRWTEPRTA
jgi:hypothetical protein